MDDKLQTIRRPKQVERIPQSKPSRRIIKKWLLKGGPWALAVSFLILLFLLFGDKLMPAVAVEVETVVALQDNTLRAEPADARAISGGKDPFSGSVLFQASGWFEADPFPYRATALASGIVEAVHVLEGQPVEKGEAIATLIREDAELKVGIAAASLEATQASLVSVQSEQKLSLAREDSMRKQIAVAEARGLELADLAERANDLGRELVSEEDIVQARLRLNTQDQTVDALRAQLREREIESEQLAGQVQVKEGLLVESEVRFREAELELERMDIRAPITGIIQRLMVAPGQKKVLMADNPESATVALLFQPEHLQARIDVPIAEASRLFIGQAVLVESEYLPGKELHGHIQRITGEADLQRNTLQVKIRIENPPTGLRPEILCRAKFLDRSTGLGSDGSQSTRRATDGEEIGQRLSILVSRQALFGSQGTEALVWAIDASGRRIEQRQLKLSGEERDGYLVVLSGLRPGDRIVLNPSGDLENGTRVEY